MIGDRGSDVKAAELPLVPQIDAVAVFAAGAQYAQRNVLRQRVALATHCEGARDVCTKNPGVLQCNPKSLAREPAVKACTFLREFMLPFLGFSEKQSFDLMPELESESEEEEYGKNAGEQPRESCAEGEDQGFVVLASPVFLAEYTDATAWTPVSGTSRRKEHQQDEGFVVVACAEVLTAAGGRDEAEALLRVEPLDRARRHAA